MWLELQIFGFRAIWSRYILGLLVFAGLVYYVITGPTRHLYGDVGKRTIKHQFLFYRGLADVCLIKGSPIDFMSHIMLRAHLIQMALLYFLVPIMLIRRLPVWMWRRFIRLPIIKPLFRFFTLPLIALALFNGLFLIYYIPVIFVFSKSSPTAHFIITLGLFIFAVFRWWPVVTPVKEMDVLQPLLKIGYL